MRVDRFWEICPLGFPGCTNYFVGRNTNIYIYMYRQQMRFYTLYIACILYCIRMFLHNTIVTHP